MHKRLDEARRAFRKRKLSEGAAAHTPERITEAAEEHGAGHQYVGEMVYGGLDGIITTFAVVSGVAGANLGVNIILILGIANLVADGFSMATGAFLSARSQGEFYDREEARERWEVENFPEGERQELFDIYSQLGYSEDDIERLVEIETRDTDRWVRAMMLHELGLIKDDRKPFLIGLATFGSFAVFGFVPLLTYILAMFTAISFDSAFPITIALTVVALFLLGAAKVFVTGLSVVRSGLEMVLVGSLAGGVAYGIGWLLHRLIGNV